MSISDARKEKVNFSIPYWTIKQVLVAKADAGVTPEKAMSGGNKVGVQRGLPKPNGWKRI